MWDGFVRRWSRRKRASEATPDGALPDTAHASVKSSVEPLDLAELPAVADLDAFSDYTVFMKEGVPNALRLAALRRAWVTDPVIVGHRALADYDWDFNASDYGRLRASDQPAKLISALFDHLNAGRDTGNVGDTGNTSAPVGHEPLESPGEGPKEPARTTPGVPVPADTESLILASEPVDESGAEPLKIRNNPPGG